MLPQLVMNGVIVGGVYSLIALSFTLIYGTVRFFHFAHGALCAVGAYLAYTGSMLVGAPFVVSAVVACGVVGLLGVAVDRIVYAPLRRQKAPGLVFLIASFGVFIVLQNALQLVFGSQTLRLSVLPVKEGYHVLGATITGTQIVILAISGVLTVGLWLVVQKTKMGKAMRAVSDDPVAASIVGINPERIIMAAFAVGSALAGMAGILIALESNIEPTMGMNAILKGIVASIIGGAGRLRGAVLGAFLLGFAENASLYVLPAGWKDAVAFAILITFLLVKPNGILGSKDVVFSS